MDRDGRLRRLLSGFCGALNAIALAAAALVTAIMIPSYFTPFFTHEYDKNNTYEQVNMEPEDLMEVTRHMMGYLAGEEEELNIETRVAGETRLFFSEREVFHMEDVRMLFDLAFNIRRAACAVVLVTLGLIYLLGKHWRSICQAWRIVPAGICGIVAFVAIAGALNFDAVFTLFHQIFFTNDLWLLNPSVDLLVNIVPQQFFIDIAICVCALFMLALALMFTAGALLGRRLSARK